MKRTPEATIKAGGHEFSVLFHDSVEDLRAAIVEKKSTLGIEGDHSRTHSCVWPEVTYSGGDMSVPDVGLGQVHLLRDLRTGVLCHEALHAAIHLLKVLKKSDVITIDDSMVAEEELAGWTGLIACEIRSAHLALFPEG